GRNMFGGGPGSRPDLVPAAGALGVAHAGDAAAVDLHGVGHGATKHDTAPRLEVPPEALVELAVSAPQEDEARGGMAPEERLAKDVVEEDRGRPLRRLVQDRGGQGIPEQPPGLRTLAGAAQPLGERDPARRTAQGRAQAETQGLSPRPPRQAQAEEAREEVERRGQRRAV